MGRQKANPTYLESRDDAGEARFQKLRYRVRRWVEAEHDLSAKQRQKVFAERTPDFDRDDRDWGDDYRYD